MEKIMSKTKHTESREVHESGELTDDKLAAVVGGQDKNLKLAREDFRDGDYASGMGHLAAYYASVRPGWL
jgi:hypothetical protein